MRILITGHKGFIGGRAVEFFSQNHEIFTYDWHPTKRPSLKSIDCVMHFGAISSTTEKDIEKVLRQNLDFSIWLYNEASHHAKLFQYSSSASVYGRTNHFTESGPVDPQSPYAWSKYLFERYVRNNPCDMITQAFRYFNVYGRGEEHKEQPSPHTAFERQARQNNEIILYEGEAHRDFVPVETVLNIHQRFLSIPKSGVWNVGTGKTTTFSQIAQQIAKEFKVPIRIKEMPENMIDQYQWYTCANTEHLNETIKE